MLLSPPPRKRSLSFLCYGNRWCCDVIVLLVLIICPVAVFCFNAHASSSSSSSSVHAESDRIDNLPGYPFPLPSPWYSGYLTYTLDSRVVHTHYIYVEAEPSASSSSSSSSTTNGSDDDDDDDDDDTTPLLYWSNGGPGASSMFGLLTELGPLLLNDLSLQTSAYQTTGIPTPIRNPYSWTRLGSILIFDAPAPVGFSYCNNDIQGDGYSCSQWTDETAAENNFLALEAFYDRFPSLKYKPLYLIGESYAGIYVPMLAQKILQHNSASLTTDSAQVRNRGYEKYEVNQENIPLMGFAVGDACVGTKSICGSNPYEPYFRLLFFAGHGQISFKTYRKTMEACGWQNQDVSHTATRAQHTKRNVPPTSSFDPTLFIHSPECQQSLQKAKDEVGYFYGYSLYDDCTYRNGESRRRRHRLSDVTMAGDAATLQHSTLQARGAVNDYPCGGTPVMTQYLSLPIVRTALHVPVDAAFFDGDNGQGFNYTATQADLSSFYIDVAQGQKYKSRIRMMVYNGDTDPSITSFVAENWTESLGLTEVEPWRPWTIDGCRRLGGHVTRYDGLDFVTIRGSGHMVPTYKPEAAFVFLKSWLDQKEYPRYEKECVHPDYDAFGGGIEVEHLEE